jgi:leucyl aminopeptidase
MHITVGSQPIQSITADALIVNVFEGAETPTGATDALDAVLTLGDVARGGAIHQLLSLGDFKGKLNETAVVYAHGLIAAPRVILVGLGKHSEFSVDKARQASGSAVRRARDLGCKRVASIAHGAGAGGLDPRAAAAATAEGALLGAYQFREHKSRPADAKHIDELIIAEIDAARFEAINAGVGDGIVMADAINAARRWINLGPNVLQPASLAADAQAMAQRTGLRCEVFDERQLQELGMGGVLTVAKGSAAPPRFVVLEHAPAGHENEAPLILVGKGVTFDSGGYSIKTADGMSTMKGDMAGAAAVIGALQAIAGLQPQARVIALAPMVENMINSGAMRPGDVMTTLSGITVEIVNTDAEGRLILCDALHYAKRFKPRAVVDIATLTGVSSMAMGEGMAASVLGNNDALCNALLGAAARAGERLWRMPLYPEYADKIKSDVAEIKNSGGAKSGLGSSAIFLKRFVDGADSYPWAHIDMAGMAFWSESKGYCVRGGSGFGVRTLATLAGC